MTTHDIADKVEGLDADATSIGVHSDQLSLLRTYLRDHEAAAVGGLQLFRRCCKANRGTAYAAELQRLTEEIRSDRDALRRICLFFVAEYSNVGRAAAYAGATLGRVKMNGRVFKYSPLSRVLELEALSGGVMTKLRLWESLLPLSAVDERLDEDELKRRIAGAIDQLAALQRLHDMAADEAFSLS
jgi:hypothetical protein